MAISKIRFREALNKFYTKDELFRLFKKYFLNWIAEGYIGSNLGLFEISLITADSNKNKFLDLIEQVFSKKEVFLTILNTLPKDIQDMFVTIAWEGRMPITDREKFQEPGKEFTTSIDLKDEYLFFKIGEGVKKDEYLYIDNDIVRMYRSFLPKVRDYYIYSVQENPKLLKDNNESCIVENLSSYFNFFNDGKLQLSNSGKLLKASKNDMCRYCNIKEYYSDAKDLDFLKTETIALFFFLMKKEFLTREYFRITNLKNIILDFLDGKNIKSENSVYIGLYLNYLKGIKKIDKDNEEIKRAIGSIKDALLDMPDDKPVSVENIIKYILYRDKFIEILDIKDVYENIYINEANYERTKILSYFKYKAYIIEPFIKSILFILSAFGVLEIYYDLPSENNALYLKHGYLSKFDGLKAVKFTNLGKYIFDRQEKYDFKEEEEGQAILEDDRLIITIIGDSPIKVLFLESIGIRIADNKFKITQESFLKKVTSKKVLLEKIDEFKKKINYDLNDLWKKFFKELLDKMEYVQLVPEYRVLKLEQDKTLINIITKDRRLSNIILKAENFHILIKEENIEKLAEILKENGYFFNF
ncbi:hypothetical protein [Fusobacterium sp.]|uniref:hypothetical protein n=1 Tax=Fusobacterium sp. TaxID=68766 RepID=UPI00262C0A12|nr:hypothetical protein [Fusobacterium sp.]